MPAASCSRGSRSRSSGEEWVFPLDLVPRLIAEDEWDHIEAGVVQRVRALEAFLDDVYGDRHVLRDGVVPHSLVVHEQQLPPRRAPASGPPRGVRIHLAGIDLVRGADGVIRVLEDNLRMPSGISYVIENRRGDDARVPRAVPRAPGAAGGRLPATLLDSLRAAAPAGVDDPTVVLLSPGIYNSAYFEHAFLARKMGIELVEGRDLVCRDNVLYMRTTAGEQRVDVVYRRIDDDFLDPLQFRPDSVIGSARPRSTPPVPARHDRQRGGQRRGRRQADLHLRAGADRATTSASSRCSPNVATYRLDEPDVLAYALDRADQLVFKPVDGSGGHGIVIGPHASDEELAAVGRAGARRARAAGSPRSWSMLSTVPSKDGDDLAPAPRRPPPVRHQRRRARARPARRADQGGAARGHDGRQLQPGRRVQGHLGARRRSSRPSRVRDSPFTVRAASVPAVGARPRPGAASRPSSSSRPAPC